MPDSLIALSLASNQELAQELLSRYEVVVIGAVSDANTPNEVEILLQAWGPALACEGICHRLLEEIRKAHPNIVE